MLASYLDKAKAAVVFSGAGMSTESGLQDFRSADRGMWNDRNPMELASVEAMTARREEFVKFYQWRIEQMNKHQPHQGHHLLAKWERESRLRGIITQNVDNYHEQAGSENVAKLHGDLGTLRCLECSAQFPAASYLPPTEQTMCRCGGFIRPNIVLFGEALSEIALEKVQSLIQDVDLFIVLGSSLQVSPANQFPQLAKQQGAKLIIVNRESTPLDPVADLTIHDSVGTVLAQADAELR